MKSVKVKCPAKINLNLKVTGKRPDGYHNIESVMQTISLYDFLTISVEDFERLEITLNGNCAEIPYDKTNLVYKAAKLFFDSLKISDKKVSIRIEKNIPVAAGLAGGSTDGAGTLFGLNSLFNNIFSEAELHLMCAKLGSDLNVCLKGGCLMTSGRGEIVTPADFKYMKVSLIKPRDLGISAKYAYQRFSEKTENGIDIDTRPNFVNDLEWAVITDYPELQYIKAKYPNAVMTGSGSTYFSLNDNFNQEDGYVVFNSLETVKCGVELSL